MLFLQALHASHQRVGDLQVFMLGLVFMVGLVVVERSVHLLDCGYDTLSLFHQIRLLGGDQSYLVVQSFRERRKQLQEVSLCFAQVYFRATFLRLATLTFAVGNSNLVEEAVELANDCRNLGGEITGVHDGRAQQKSVKCSRTWLC